MLQSIRSRLPRKVKKSAPVEQSVTVEQSLDRVCQTCDGALLELIRLHKAQNTSGVEASFGTFSEVSQRSVSTVQPCPYCRLIVTAITGLTPQQIRSGERFSIDLCAGDEVRLRWHPERGFRFESKGFERWIIYLPDEEPEIRSQAGVGRWRKGGMETANAQSPPDVETPCSKDIDFMKRQLMNCQETHGSSCNSETDKVQDWFREMTVKSSPRSDPRLVDVRSLCLVYACDIPIDRSNEYITLSYVWGGLEFLRLTSGVEEALMETDGLRRLWDYLPRTIQDAIILTRWLEVPYLWVDALCLRQDDRFGIQIGIENMDLIYKNALFTIIAASGSDANASLPGVSSSVRNSGLHVEHIDNKIKMTVLATIDSYLQTCKYSQRAWTLQELVLSQRQMIFTLHGGVFFRCPKRDCSLAPLDAQYVDTEQPTPNKLSLALEPSEEGLIGDGFGHLLREYTSRNLTKQSDALNAFRALQDHLSRNMPGHYGKFLQGMPTEAFDCFLLFGGDGMTLERREGFPSWSWAGWKGRIGSGLPPLLRSVGLLKEWLKTRTWIVWYQRRRWQPPMPVWPLEDNTKLCGPDKDWDAWKGFNFKDHGCPDQIDCSQTEPTESLTLPPSRCKSCLLQFWTLSIHLTISDIATQVNGRNINPRAIFANEQGIFCGSSRLDGNYFTEKDIGKPVEVIVLSEIDFGTAAFDLREYTGNTQFRDGFDLYWVLLIKRDEDGLVAERRGLGQIYQTAVTSSLPPGPAWKEIFLA